MTDYYSDIVYSSTYVCEKLNRYYSIALFPGSPLAPTKNKTARNEATYSTKQCNLESTILILQLHHIQSVRCKMHVSSLADSTSTVEPSLTETSQ